jgi:hypothetical protein
MAALPTGEMYCSCEKHQDFGGMTLLDYFAARAMQGIVRNYADCGVLTNAHVITANAYAVAEAMLAERERRRKESTNQE